MSDKTTTHSYEVHIALTVTEERRGGRGEGGTGDSRGERIPEIPEAQDESLSIEHIT